LLEVARQSFARLAETESIGPAMIADLCALLRAAGIAKIAGEVLSALDAAGLADRLRPAREALAAAAAGDIEVLHGVAPEIRRPALELLALIEPKLVDRALPPASL
jgi:hypothetical protein